MTISIPAIETEASTLFHAAITRATSFLKAVVGIADKGNALINSVAPEATAALAAFAPQDSAALAATVGVINLVDSTIDSVASEVSGGVTLTLPAALVADWKKAKAGLIAFESVI